MAEVEDKGAWYQRGMSKAILLVDSDSIVFYDRYKNLLQYNREISRFLHTFRTEHKGREQKFGRLQQLFLLYDRRKCSNLKNYFKKTFYAFVHLIEMCIRDRSYSEHRTKDKIITKPSFTPITKE